MPRRLIPAVNLQKLTTQITNEIKRSPAKAAVLGGLLLIAVWFWFPLIKGWVGWSNASRPPETAEAVAIPQPVEPTATKPAPKHVAGKSNWRSIATEIADDPLMQTGELRTKTFDPFFPEPSPTTHLTTAEPKLDKVSMVDVTPETAGLSISSVIVGGAHPIARINNQNYHVGDKVSGTDGLSQFTLLEVNGRGVILQGSQHRHELHLEEFIPNSKHRLVLRNGNLISSEN